jgi:hypothetical protein
MLCECVSYVNFVFCFCTSKPPGKKRTQKLMAKKRAEALRMNAQDRATYDSQYGMHWDEPALARATRHTEHGYLDICPSDTMHTLFKGLYEFVWNTVIDSLLKDHNVPSKASVTTRRAIIDDRFERFPKFFGNRRKTRKFISVTAMGTKTASDMELILQQVRVNVI